MNDLLFQPEDLDLLSTEIDRCESYKAEMFLKEKE